MIILITVFPKNSIKNIENINAGPNGIAIYALLFTTPFNLFIESMAKNINTTTKPNLTKRLRVIQFNKIKYNTANRKNKDNETNNLI